MKRLFFLSMFFALIAGVALAADISVDVIGKFVPLAGDSREDSEVKTGGGMGRIRIGAEAQNEEGNVGGWIRFDAGADYPGYYGLGLADTYGENISPSGFVWWKPIEQVKIQFGSNPDGHFEDRGSGLIGWGFYQVAGDVRVAMEDWAYGSFFGGTGAPGAYISITPIEGLGINLHVPFKPGDAKNVYKHIIAQIGYNINGVGKIGFTFQGNDGEKFNKTTKKWIEGTEYVTGIDGDGSKLFVTFSLTSVENLVVDFGLSYTLASAMANTTYNAPVAAGLAASYSADAFGIKARVQGEFGGKVTFDAAGAKDYNVPAVIMADILPSYAATDKLSISLDAGLKITSALDDDSTAYALSLAGTNALALSDETIVGWHVMPYVGIKAHSWAPSVYIGFRLESSGIKGADNKAITTWSVPIGMAFSF